MTAGSNSDLMEQAVSTALSLPPSTIPILSGYAAFASSLALSTLLQLKVLGISTGSPRPIPSLVGIASVALSSLASHSAAVQAHEFCRNHGLVVSSPKVMTTSPKDESSSALEPSQWRSELLNFGTIQIDKQVLRM